MALVKPMKTTSIVAVVTIWFFVAAGLGLADVYRFMKPPGPQLAIALLTGTLLFLVYQFPSFGRWFFTVDERVLLAPHLLRFVGFYFLFLFQMGELPYRFAVPGGWGDIGVAFIAMMLISSLRITSVAGWCAYFAWNMAGIFDLFFVVGTAARLGLNDPFSMRMLLKMPLCLLPVWLVPILFTTHLMLILRLLVQRPE